MCFSEKKTSKNICSTLLFFQVPPTTAAVAPPLPTSLISGSFPLHTNVVSAGITMKNTSKVLISGTLSRTNGLVQWKTTVLGQWDIVACDDLTFQHLHLQSNSTGMCVVAKSNNINIIHCNVEFCKKKGIVYRDGSAGSIDACTISNNAGFAGLLVHGYETRLTLSDSDIRYNSMSGLWVRLFFNCGGDFFFLSFYSYMLSLVDVFVVGLWACSSCFEKEIKDIYHQEQSLWHSCWFQSTFHWFSG